MNANGLTEFYRELAETAQPNAGSITAAGEDQPEYWKPAPHWMSAVPVFLTA